ncbi:MAG: response regulator [Cytophagales bacterium]|nr:response regulator [Cytophagales bacterium]
MNANLLKAWFNTYDKKVMYVNWPIPHWKPLRRIVLHEYDCILLDITLPDGNGFTILEKLKQEEKLEGVIIISAKNSLDDKIKGLNLGADDYLAKPFHLSEMEARISAVIRRKRFHGNNSIPFHELTIDLLGKVITLTIKRLT